MVVAGGYTGGVISGGCFNPAVALGVALQKYDKGSTQTGALLMMYWGAELGGALTAVIFYRFGVHAEEYQQVAADPKKRMTTIQKALNDDDRTAKPTMVAGEVSHVSKLLSEIIGTFYLVYTVLVAIHVGTSMGAHGCSSDPSAGGVNYKHSNPKDERSFL